MKKVLVAAAIVAATGITALSLGKTSAIKQVKVTKSDRTEVVSKTFSIQKDALGSAD